MGFLKMADTREWQVGRSHEEGWLILEPDWEGSLGVTRTTVMARVPTGVRAPSYWHPASYFHASKRGRLLLYVSAGLCSVARLVACRFYSVIGLFTVTGGDPDLDET